MRRQGPKKARTNVWMRVAAACWTRVSTARCIRGGQNSASKSLLNSRMYLRSSRIGMSPRVISRAASSAARAASSSAALRSRSSRCFSSKATLAALRQQQYRSRNLPSTPISGGASNNSSSSCFRCFALSLSPFLPFFLSPSPLLPFFDFLPDPPPVSFLSLSPLSFLSFLLLPFFSLPESLATDDDFFFRDFFSLGGMTD
mmetsp:Transcript_18281/g.34184  ORF Transcript_18281/g.34184 Transcript_18281/m.34184 type:complete len:201 (-) Transcript_18281:196-798(-)